MPKDTEENFVDLEKAFNIVTRIKQWNAMHTVNIDNTYIKIIEKYTDFCNVRNEVDSLPL